MKHPEMGHSREQRPALGLRVSQSSPAGQDRKLETDRLALTLRAQRPQVCLVADAAEARLRSRGDFREVGGQQGWSGEGRWKTGGEGGEQICVARKLANSRDLEHFK